MILVLEEAVACARARAACGNQRGVHNRETLYVREWMSVLRASGQGCSEWCPCGAKGRVRGGGIVRSEPGIVLVVPKKGGRPRGQEACTRISILRPQGYRRTDLFLFSLIAMTVGRTCQQIRQWALTNYSLLHTLFESAAQKSTCGSSSRGEEACLGYTLVSTRIPNHWRVEAG